MQYNKLVRDKIIEIMDAKGLKPISHIADEEEYWQKLKEKLSEEVQEFLVCANSTDGNLGEIEIMEELADVVEVIDAICAYKKFSQEELLKIKRSKAEQRGTFKKRIILEES